MIIEDRSPIFATLKQSLSFQVTAVTHVLQADLPELGREGGYLEFKQGSLGGLLLVVDNVMTLVPDSGLLYSGLDMA